MAILTGKPATLKVGVKSGSITLNTANLVSDFSVTDPYWSVPANWSAVDLHYFDATSTNHRILTFVSSGFANTFMTSTRAKPNTWVVTKLVIRDNDGGSYIIDRGGFLTGQSQFDIIIEALIGPTKYVYSVSQDANNGRVDQFSLDDGTGLLTSIGTLNFSLGGGNVANSIVATPNGKWLYCGTQLGIKRTSIDSGTGALTLLGTTGSDFYAYLAMSTDGAYLYAAHYDGSFTIAQYAINDTDGSLTALTPSSVSVDGGSNNAQYIAISPSGKWLYAPIFGTNQVRGFSIDGTGHLAALSPSFYATGGGPRSIGWSPDGASAYVGNETDDTVSEYSFNDSTGALTLIGTTASLAGPFRNPAITPDGAHLHIAATNGYVSHFSRDTGTGLLTWVADVTFSAGGANPNMVRITPNGKWAFVTGGILRGYSITAGVFTVNGSNYSVGATPVGIALV